MDPEVAGSSPANRTILLSPERLYPPSQTQCPARISRTSVLFDDGLGHLGHIQTHSRPADRARSARHPCPCKGVLSRKPRDAAAAPSRQALYVVLLSPSPDLIPSHTINSLQSRHPGVDPTVRAGAAVGVRSANIGEGRWGARSPINIPYPYPVRTPMAGASRQGRV